MKDISLKNAIAEIKRVSEWREEERTKEKVVMIDKYYTVNGIKYHSRQIWDNKPVIEELDNFPFVEFNLNNLK